MGLLLDVSECELSNVRSDVGPHICSRVPRMCCGLFKFSSRFKGVVMVAWGDAVLGAVQTVPRTPAPRRDDIIVVPIRDAVLNLCLCCLF